MVEDLYEKLETTAIEHIRAFESPKPFDAEAIYRFRSPACVMYFHPENSMPAPFGGGVTITEAEHVPALNALGAVTERLVFDIKEVTVDVKKRVVTARMHGIFDFKAVGEDPPVRDWMIEYIWITEHDESGTQIVRLEESLDVVQVLPMLDKAGRYAKENK